MDLHSNPWPELPYEQFKSTSHLLHMLTQAMGKLNLLKPFEPQWNNAALFISDHGLTTGPIPYEFEVFSVDLNILEHRIVIRTSWGASKTFKLDSNSVAALIKKLLEELHSTGIKVEINPKPQEIPHPILFDQDTEQQHYNPELAQAWWRILLSSQIVLQRYHALFLGKTQPVAFMWGTFDLRDVRFNGKKVIPTGINTGYLRRNAMNAEQVECGWWSGNEAYPKAAYYSFTYPEPSGINKIKIAPAAARWEDNLKLFILDYEDLLKSKNPAEDLFSFFQTAYEAGAKLSGWDPELLGSGFPD